MADFVCLLSGLSVSDGPRGLIDHDDLETISTSMASEILSYEHVSLSLENLTAIVSNALQLTLPPREVRDVYDRAPNMPDGVSDWGDFGIIGIGHFDENGHCCHGSHWPRELEHSCSPSGRDVQVRRLDEYIDYGIFDGVVVDDPDAKDGSGLRTMKVPSSCGSTGGYCNFFVKRSCLEYLRAWLDRSLPQRVAFLDSAPSMALEGELYEIINSRPGMRGMKSRLFYTCTTHLVI